MVILTAKISKKTKAVLSILIFGLVMALLIVLTGHRDRTEKSEQTPEIHLAANTDRITYLESYGWQLDPEPLETLQFLLPETLEEPYLTYNDLQISQGFDLRPYCGQQLSRYTYEVTNYPERPDGVQINLYICGEIPVAGDILCTGSDGFQTTLNYPETA